MIEELEAQMMRMMDVLESMPRGTPGKKEILSILAEMALTVETNRPE